MYFTNLVNLDISDNNLKLEDISVIESLVDLNISCNMVENIKVNNNMFTKLETLDIS